jgi:hypothetical protein
MREELYKRLHAPELGPCVCSQVRRLARKLSFLYDTRLSPEDLTITQYSLLANIERAGPVKPPGPGQEDRNGSTTLTRNLLPLARAKWVAVVTGKDRRHGQTLKARNRSKSLKRLIAWFISRKFLQRKRETGLSTMKSGQRHV